MGKRRDHHCYQNNKRSNITQKFDHPQKHNIRRSLKVHLNSSTSRSISPRPHFRHQFTDRHNRRTINHQSRSEQHPNHKRIRFNTNATTTNNRCRRSSSSESYTRTVSITRRSSPRCHEPQIQDKVASPAELVVPRTVENDGFIVSIKIGNKHINASVNSHRKATIVNRSVFKLSNWNACPANYDIVNIPISAGNKTLDIMCVTNYQQNVPVILGRDATNQFGFKLSITENTTVDNSVLDLDSKRDEHYVNSM